MASVKLQGNASGTGSLTVQAPNTNSNLTLGLPASNGTLVTTGDTGTVTTTMLAATGTPSSSTFLRGDGTWNAPGGVTSAVAGNGITVSGATGAVTISQDIYTGTNASNTAFPIGTYILMFVNSSPNLAASVTPYARNTADTFFWYAASAGYNALSGTWRSRGCLNYTCGGIVVIAQRTA